MESKSVRFLLLFFMTDMTTVVNSQSKTTKTSLSALIFSVLYCRRKHKIWQDQSIFRSTSSIPGIPGIPGNPERDGLPGSRGLAGAKGEPGERGDDDVDLGKSNWKQCVWKRNDGKDTGLIQNCTFNKKYDNTSLRVFYEGTLKTSGSYVCNRWYFTFDGPPSYGPGAECTKPATIDGIVHVSITHEYPYRYRHIESYCNQVPKGYIRVGFWIGKCQGSSLGSGHTGWNSMSRIVIEEVPPPQA
ncbi:Hypothetical predicted protein [Paramuricea clavata]|uniref:CTHRC1 C-terminal domain-containing protein n=1 Tax=Paramuricea clavata TaxID=317549 RepID=A0A7D9D9J7_PARCT|nr:Hypothetical predicted protein [Paramuricea clavata]